MVTRMEHRPTRTMPPAVPFCRHHLLSDALGRTHRKIARLPAAYYQDQRTERLLMFPTWQAEATLPETTSLCQVVGSTSTQLPMGKGQRLDMVPYAQEPSSQVPSKQQHLGVKTRLRAHGIARRPAESTKGRPHGSESLRKFSNIGTREYMHTPPQVASRSPSPVHLQRIATKQWLIALHRQSTHRSAGVACRRIKEAFGPSSRKKTAAPGFLVVLNPPVKCAL